MTSDVIAITSEECKRVLSLCDYSGAMLEPWRDAGYECCAVDIAYERDTVLNGITRLKIDLSGDLHGDLHSDLSGSWDWIFAFPPCTDLAASGARWWKAKGDTALKDALHLVHNCETLCKKAKRGWMLENPIGRLATHWRKPDFYFDPCDYGDDYTKRTCLWVGGDFIMPPKNRVEPTAGSKMHRLPATKNRARLRSITPRGFAEAVFNANG